MLRVAVAPFPDKRNDSEMKVMRSINEDALAAMIVKHFKHVNLFAHQEAVGIEFANPSIDQLLTLKVSGYNAILTGELANFIIYQTGSRMTVGAAIAVLLVPILVLPIAAVSSSEVLYGGVMKFSSLKLVEVPSGRILWQGEANGQVNKRASSGLMGRMKESSEEVFRLAVLSIIDQLRSTQVQFSSP